MHSRRLQEELDAAIAEGWQIEQETPDRVVLVRRNYGSVRVHVLLAVFTAWWAFGIFNLLYAGYAYASQSKRRVLRDPSGRTCPECGATSRPGAEYCPDCGARLGGERSEAAAGSETTVACPECDAVVTEGSRYCPNCGAALAESVDERSE